MMSTSVRSSARLPTRTSPRSPARPPVIAAPPYPTTFHKGQEVLAFDLLSNVWRLAHVCRVYSREWDEKRCHVPQRVWLPLPDRPKQARLQYIGWFDCDDCDVLMCDVPHRLRTPTYDNAQACDVDLTEQRDTSNHNACSNCLEGGADDGGVEPSCCEACPRLYHPDCLRFIDKLTGSQEEDDAQRKGEWTCPWCRRPELRARMRQESEKNRTRKVRDLGDTLLWWDEEREREELLAPYGPERFFQHVAEVYERNDKPKRRKKSTIYRGGRKKRQPRRQPGGRNQQQPDRVQQPTEADNSEQQQQQLEEETEETEEDGQHEAADAAATESAPSAQLLTQQAAEEAMQLVRQVEQHSSRPLPLSVLIQPGSIAARVRKRVRKTEEVDLLHEEQEANGGSAPENELKGATTSGDEMSGDCELDGAELMLDEGGDYTPMSGASGMSEAESHSPTSPTLPLPFLSPRYHEREEDNDEEHDDVDNGVHGASRLRSLTPTRDRASNGVDAEGQLVQRAKQEPLQTPPSALPSQVPANFVLSPAPHATKADRSTETPQQAASPLSSLPSHPSTSTISVAAASPYSSSVPFVQPSPSGPSAPGPSLASASVSRTRASSRAAGSQTLPDDVIVIDDSDDESPTTEPLQSWTHPLPLASNVPTPGTAPTSSTSSSSSAPSASALLSPPTLPAASSPSSSVPLRSKPRPQIRPSASPSLLSSTRLPRIPSSSSSASSSSSSPTLSMRPSLANVPAVPASDSASQSTSVSSSSSLRLSSAVLSSVAASSRPRYNRPASYSQRSIGQTGHMRSVRAGGSIQLQSGSLQLSFSSNAADGTGTLRVHGLDFTRSQQVRIGEAIIDLPPLTEQQRPATAIDTEDKALPSTSPAAHTSAQTSPPLPPVQLALLVNPAEAETDHPSRSSALSCPVEELRDEDMDENTGLQSPVSADEPSIGTPSAHHSRAGIHPTRCCCLCNRYLLKSSRRPRPSSAQLATLGYTGDVPNPDGKWACHNCGYLVEAGRLPMCLLPGVNLDNCAFCNKLLEFDKSRRPMPAAQLARLGHDRQPPHPNHAHVCHTCEHHIFKNQLCRVPDAASTIHHPSDTVPGAPDEDEKTIELPAASPSVTSASSSVPMSSRLSWLTASPSPPTVSSSPLGVSLATSEEHTLPSSFSNFVTVLTSAPPTETDMGFEMETVMREPSWPDVPVSAFETAVFTSHQKRKKGGNLSRFIEQASELATSATREKRRRKRPDRFAYAEDSATTGKGDSDSGEEERDDEASSKKMKVVGGWDEQQDKLLWELHEDGKTATAIGAVLDMRAQAVSTRLAVLKGIMSRDTASLSNQKRPWSAQQVEQLIRLCAAGHSQKQIAERLGRNEQAINHKLYKLTKCSTTARWDAQHDAQLVELHNAGRSRLEIAVAMGRRPQAVRTRLSALTPSIAGRRTSKSVDGGSIQPQSDQQQDEETDEPSKDSEAEQEVQWEKSDEEEEDDEEKETDGQTWNTQQDQQLLRLAASGMPCREIGQIMGHRSRQAVKSRLYRLRHRLTHRESQGEKIRKDGSAEDSARGGRPQEWTEEKDQRLMAMKSEGRSHHSIAGLLGVSFKSVENRVRRLRHESRADGESDTVVDEAKDADKHNATSPHVGCSPRRPWQAGDLAELKRLVAEQLPNDVIAERLGRTTGAIKKQVCMFKLRPRRNTPHSIAEREDDSDDEQQHADDSDDNQHDVEPPRDLSPETWQRLSADGPVPWLVSANEFRTLSEQLRREEKEEKAERSDDVNRPLFLVAKPVFVEAQAELKQLTQRSSERCEQKKAKYEHTAHMQQPINLCPLSFSYAADPCPCCRMFRATAVCCCGRTASSHQQSRAAGQEASAGAAGGGILGEAAGHGAARRLDRAAAALPVSRRGAVPAHHSRLSAHPERRHRSAALTRPRLRPADRPPIIQR